MPPMRWNHEAEVAASPDAVYAWMTDFSEDDHATEAFRRGSGHKGGGKPARRRVLSREGNVARILDEWGREKYDVTATMDPVMRRVSLAGVQGYRAVWKAEPSGTGTRVSVEGEMAPRGLFALLMPLFSKSLREQMRQDFEGHVEDLRSSLPK